MQRVTVCEVVSSGNQWMTSCYVNYAFVYCEGSEEKLKHIIGLDRYKQQAITVFPSSVYECVLHKVMHVKVQNLFNQYNALWAMNERAQERCRGVTSTCHVG